MTDFEQSQLRELVIATVDRARASRTSAAAEAALVAVDASALDVFFHTRLDEDATPLAVGVPASPGAASGRIVCSADAALAAGERGEAVILVRSETGPDDVAGMQAARGILTSRGGVVSHAAVVARGWGIPAVVGAATVHVDDDEVQVGTTVLRAGDEITIDGATGEVYAGALAISGESPPAELDVLLAWADTVGRGHVEVRANADTPADAARARRLGARGIGLCRTEHMFLAPDRLEAMRRFVLSDDPATEAAALRELEAAQTEDFVGVLDAMDGLPVTVRLLDPPLHEFLPDIVGLTARDARGELSDFERKELAATRRLHEVNPMLGTRGVRLGILRRGLYEMQVRALCVAAARLFEAGKQPRVQVMIPLVVDAEELRISRAWVADVLTEIGHPELAVDVVTFGAMIETPRAALTAARLAEHADFFSFGTNDLTQTVYAFSRDDVEARLVPAYLDEGILWANPFVVLDQEGVGTMVRVAAEAARAAKPSIELGACGEHAGDPISTGFLVELGIDSLSCSPFRVPVTRLAVAQALLASGRVRSHDLTFDFDIGSRTSGGTRSDPTPTPPSDAPTLTIDEATVLHVLRIRGFVTPAGLLASLGADPSEIVAALVDAGMVRRLEARDLYGLLPPGRERQEALIPTYTSDELRDALAAGYERFLGCNATFKVLCNDWQMRDGQPNDHADAAYDRACIDRLLEHDADARPALTALTDALPRLARYTARLAAAAAAVDAGDTDRFTGVMTESYHDIWMELHEDLIVLQGIDRVEEASF